MAAAARAPICRPHLSPILWAVCLPERVQVKGRPLAWIDSCCKNTNAERIFACLLQNRRTSPLPILTHSTNGHTVREDFVDQARLLAALRGLRAGDFGVRLPLDWTGVPGTISEAFNEVVELNQRLVREFEHISRTVGREGKTEQRASLGSASGGWAASIESINLLIADLTQSNANVRAQLTDLTRMATDRDRVLSAVARGDLSQRVALDVDGRPLEGAFLRSGQVVNSMIQTLAIFADQVTTVAREVGTEGKLGGQAAVPGADGSWKAVTDTVNSMAANLTRQVRDIAEVTTAVATGDLSKKITVVVSGEIGALAETINSMGDTLATMADQVTTVAREVGTQGKLGGQAQVTGVDGTWKSLTDSVNSMAANLTAQVRAIGEVSTAVTKGDLSRSIKVDAQGEIGQLKDTINEMISNLRETTHKSMEQDWLKTSLARFTRTLQGQRELQTVGNLILSELAVLVNAQHGVLYVNRLDQGRPLLQLVSTYAYRERKALAQEFRLGEGLVGQCAYEKSRILLTEVPGDYVHISSGLGTAPPLNIVVLPVLFEGDVKAVIELASFDRFSDTHLSFLDQLTESVGVVMNTISATARTEELLTQSQALSAERLQTNDQLEQKALLLSEQNEEVERQKQEMDVATAALQQKAEQLALTSKYKSQFLANMSHELRTPLNSMLILSEQLAENDDNNLSPKQVEFATTILGAGNDLLALINDILDLSKIESGMLTADLGEVSFEQLEDNTRQTFEPVARAKRLAFTVDLDPGLPRSMHTDSARLQQVLKNLLSNAFKFTERGSVGMAVSVATGGWSPDHEALNRADTVISFAVSDTGIGIPADKLAVIFEAFQQADMTTSRRFGGTGLGLSISREIATLLGGEIGLSSEPRQGSCFTLYLPLKNRRPAGDRTSAPREPEAPPQRRRAPERPAFVPRPRPPVVDEEVFAPEEDRSGARTGQRRRRPGHHSARRQSAVDRRRRPALHADAAGRRPRARLQRPDRAARGDGLEPGAQVQAGGGDARHRAAGPGRLEGPGRAETRPQHPPHPRAHHLGRRPAAEGARAWRGGGVDQAGDQEVARPGVRSAGQLRQSPGQEPAGGRARCDRPHDDAGADRRRRCADDHGLDRCGGPRRTGSAEVRLHGARSRPARHDRLRADLANQAVGARARADRGLQPQGLQPR